MIGVIKSKVLRGCKFVVNFLREQDQFKYGYDLKLKNKLVDLVKASRLKL